jgi:Acetyltransferase (GNAT) domain
VSAVTLTGIGAAARDVWQSALAGDRDALVSQTPQWMDCVCASGAYEDATRAYRTADGHNLVLPLARRRLPGMPTMAASMPFGWGTGGLVSSRGKVSPQDVDAVLTEVLSQRAFALGVRPCPRTADVWAATIPEGVVQTRHMSQIVDLSGGFDVVWGRVAATVRSHCRKAERRGVTVERDDTGRLVTVFDGLYRKSVERWAHQQHEPLWLARWRASRRDPPDKFSSVARILGPRCRVWVAWREGVPLAALVVLVHGQHASMWRGAMDAAASRGTGATELLHRSAIAEACAEGRRFYHLGDSAPSSALAHTKRKLGANDLHYSGYRFERVPLTAAERVLRAQVKRVIGFRD